MKILILEYATASGLNDPSLCSEGHAMLSGLINDFKARNADYLLSKDAGFQAKHCNPIEIEEDLIDWLEKNIELYDACLPIAPEEDLIFFEITELIEKKDVKVIGSDSDAVSICSDKFKMYEALKDDINIIKTEKIFFDEIDNYNPSFENKKVIKPADGVSCSGVNVVNSFDELKMAASSMQTTLPYFVVQDFIDGISASVSLLSNGEEAIPLSLNLQKIQFEDNGVKYNGGEVPFDHEMGLDAKQVAKEAVESINGLKGYVGVDLILGDTVHVVEINSRLTTPYIALKDLLDFNLGEAIFESVYGIFPSNVNLKGKAAFFKEDNEIKLVKLS